MKRLSSFAALMLLGISCFAQTTNLPKPNLQRQTLTVMETFQQRKSVREYRPEQLSEQDLSDLLWAACGVNRDNGNLTAPTAMNRQEIRLYVVCEKGISLYDPKAHTLTQVAEGDHRTLIAGSQAFAKEAPISLLMVGDFDKFGSTAPHAKTMVAVDAGIVSQNIDIFCTAAGLATVPRATMDVKALQSILGLNENQVPLLNNPVGYPKK